MVIAQHNTLLYSCVDAQQRGHEQFVSEHTLGYMLSGESLFQNIAGTERHGPGTIGLVRRNQLIKSIKIPPVGGQFKSISIVLDQDTLRRYSAEHNLSANGLYIGPLMIDVSADPFIKGYFDSLLPYFDKPAQLTTALIALKTQEAIALLLSHDPALKNFLFDFSDPHKIDLEAFMQQHYMYNVPASQFARLTGRSLATFKRDFQKIFGTSPQKWLQHKRLEEAHYLIAKRSQKPSNVYLEVGFENFSHFSYAFKQQFGYNPSSLHALP